MLRIKGQDQNARGALVNSSHEQQIDIMTRDFEAVPQNRKFYGVRRDRNGQPNRARVQQATLVIEFICFTLPPFTAAPR